MHVTTKEVDESGVHILTSIIEGDGATALASEKAELSAKIVSVQRTESGGIQVQAAVEVKEPAPPPAPVVEAPKPELSADEQAVAYFVGKGFSEATAKQQVERFGADRVLATRNKELSDELQALVAPKPGAPVVN